MPRPIHRAPRPNSLRFRQLECGSDKKTCASRPRTLAFSTKHLFWVHTVDPQRQAAKPKKRTPFPAAKPRRHSLGIGFLCSNISDPTCFGQTGAGSGRTTERAEPADKLNKRWRKIPFKHAKPTFLKTIVSACHSVKLMPRWKHLPAIRPARKEKSE